MRVMRKYTFSALESLQVKCKNFEVVRLFFFSMQHNLLASVSLSIAGSNPMYWPSCLHQFVKSMTLAFTGETFPFNYFGYTTLECAAITPRTCDRIQSQ